MTAAAREANTDADGHRESDYTLRLRQSLAFVLRARSMSSREQTHAAETPEDDQAKTSRLLRLRFEAPPDPEHLDAAWKAHIAPVFEVSFRPETDLSGPLSMTSYHLGELLVGDVVAPAHTLERSVTMINAQGVDHILLQFYRSGRSLVINGSRQCSVTETQLVIFDLAQPVRIVAAPVAATNLLIPRALLLKADCQPARLHGQPFDYDGDPAGRLLYAFLSNVVSCGDQLVQDDAPALSEAIAQLCGRCLVRLPPKADEATETSEEQVGLALDVRRFIERDLGDPTLAPARIMQHFGLSRSALYRLFEGSGGVGSYIRDRRLMRAIRMLIEAKPAGNARISSVAYAVGFNNDRSFGRAFKQRFGFIPSQAGIQTSQRGQDMDGTSLLMHWMKNL